MTESASPSPPPAPRSRARARTERPPRCEQTKREDGRPCRRDAGRDTDHFGVGPCSLHDDGSWRVPPFAENLEAREAFLGRVRADKHAGLRELIRPLGYHRRDVTALLEADQVFEEDYLEARGYDDDALRTELARRAIDGGSDRLLEFEAKMRLPEGQALQRHRLDGQLTVTAAPFIDVSRLTLEELELLRGLLEKARPALSELGPDQRPALELLPGNDPAEADAG